MSVLIKGMEMPKNCAECPCFSEWDDCGINHEWKFADEFDKTKDRLPSCPLLPLPEGHGRLGDLDALRKEFPEPEDWKDFAQAVQHITGIWATIDNAPTIVPAEGGGEDG